MSILEVKGLTHSYSGNTPFVNDAVSNVSFSIEKGEIIERGSHEKLIAERGQYYRLYTGAFELD